MFAVIIKGNIIKLNIKGVWEDFRERLEQKGGKVGCESILIKIVLDKNLKLQGLEVSLSDSPRVDVRIWSPTMKKKKDATT